MSFSNVLILESESSSDAQSMAKALSIEGINVVRVDNKRDALMALNEHFFDVVISDISRPVLEGLEFCRRVYGNVPVVAVSTYQLEERLIDDICDCFLEKSDVEDFLYKAAIKAIERKKIRLRAVA